MGGGGGRAHRRRPPAHGEERRAPLGRRDLVDDLARADGLGPLVAVPSPHPVGDESEDQHDEQHERRHQEEERRPKVQPAEEPVEPVDGARLRVTVGVAPGRVHRAPRRLKRAKERRWHRGSNRAVLVEWG